MANPEEWYRDKEITPEKWALARVVLREVLDGVDVIKSIRRHPLQAGGYIAKHMVVAAYREFVKEQNCSPDPAVLARIRMKPVRSLSGVTTVTVLTAPAPCPGECIFCPADARMPKSYLPDEPGAARAFQNNFDPFLQVNSRLDSYLAVGHPTEKIELLILGGTWSVYPRHYQEWFVKRCFDALNRVDTPTLADAHIYNETGDHRNVGLVIETRPDQVTAAELAELRRLGVTKVQMGAQSMDDRILRLSRRGHTSAQTVAAAALLRAAGFKIVMHWMPNLPGATLASDKDDFTRLWRQACPDELKIYPTQLLENSDLYAWWQRGEYTPYTSEELIGLIADIKPTIPVYCRVNRIIRDIPATHVVAGNKRTSLRMDILAELERRGRVCRCIRCREVKDQLVHLESLHLEDEIYRPGGSEEHFMAYVTPDDRLAGYLRLSMPLADSPLREHIESGLFADLKDAAIIREVHVYGQSLAVGSEQDGAAQHIGLGTLLIQKAEELARAAGYKRLVVIAAIGTRRYYAARGFNYGTLYMTKDL